MYAEDIKKVYEEREFLKRELSILLQHMEELKEARNATRKTTLQRGSAMLREVEDQIQQAGTRIRHLHVSDWLSQTKDLRLDRGMPGDGCIDNRKIRTWMEREGFKGPVEVEIFSAFDWWLRPADEMVKTICDRLEFL